MELSTFTVNGQWTDWLQGTGYRALVCSVSDHSIQFENTVYLIGCGITKTKGPEDTMA